MLKHISDYPDVLTVEEVKEILQIGRKSAYRLIETNEIQHFRIGTKIRIPKQCLIDYLNKCGAQGEQSC
jgi:excisionase family DNA binding protein